MSADTLFVDHITQLKRRVRFSDLNRIFLSALTLFLCVTTILRGIETIGIYQIKAIKSLFVISIGLSLGLSLLHAAVKMDRFTDKLIDIDVFSPGGLGTAQSFEKVNFNEAVILALEQKVDYMAYYRRRFDNVDMATL